MREFSMGNGIGPSGRLIATENAKIRFYFLVDPFCFSIRLRVVGGGEGEIILKDAA